MIIQSDSMLLRSSRSYQSKTYSLQTATALSANDGATAASSDSFSGFGNSLKQVITKREDMRNMRLSPLSERLETVRRMRTESLNYLFDLLFGQKSVGSGGFSYQTTRYTSYFTYNEDETTSFSAQGKVVTGDGRTIDFSMNLLLSRSFTEQTSSFIDYTQPVLCDPLVINLDTASANVTDQKFFFDLDSDGTEEEISMLGEKSGYLALDRNGDGIINDGSELFGTKSGNGFADLVVYDIDKNGWIDEADEIFEKLKVWMMDSDGTGRLLSLKEAGVGAIYLGSSSTEFSLKNAGNATNAIIRATGMFLYEDGRAGTMQQLDLAT